VQGITHERIAALKEPGGRSRADLFSPEEQAILRYTEFASIAHANSAPRRR
jgi:hypothetical protein